VLTTAAGTFTADVDGPGGGPLVLLLHGFPQSRHTWRAQQPALAAAGFRTVAFDQRGYSPGVRPDPADLAGYHLDRLVDDVLDVAAACGADAFHLVGHDWGGAVAWTVADRHPERLRSLTVLSRPHPSAFQDALRSDADDQRHRSRHHRAFDDPNTAAMLLADDARRLRRGMVDNGVPADAVDLYVSVLGTVDALDAALAWYRATSLGAVSIGPITVPTMYLWGDHDHTVGRTAAEATARYVDAPYELVEIASGGHFLTDDHPGEVTTALLRNVSSSAAGGSSRP
jgi:pimeloyl-ACP methyl ester carboxylesterase